MSLFSDDLFFELEIKRLPVELEVRPIKNTSLRLLYYLNKKMLHIFMGKENRPIFPPKFNFLY